MNPTLARIAKLLAVVASLAARAAEPGDIMILPGEIATPRFDLGVTDQRFDPAWEWQALVCTKSCRLEATQLSMTPIDVPVYDGDPLPGHVYRLTQELDAHPIVLLRAPAGKLRRKPESWLHAGQGEYPAARTGGTLEVEIPLPGDGIARIVPRFAIRDDGTRGFNVYIESGTRRQLLATPDLDGTNEPPGMPRGPHLVRWAGDLDGDEKLDLIMSFSARGDVEASAVLFLSTAAKPGELVGRVAEFTFWPPSNPGC